MISLFFFIHLLLYFYRVYVIDRNKKRWCNWTTATILRSDFSLYNQPSFIFTLNKSILNSLLTKRKMWLPRRLQNFFIEHYFALNYSILLNLQYPLIIFVCGVKIKTYSNSCFPKFILYSNKIIFEFVMDQKRNLSTSAPDKLFYCLFLIFTIFLLVVLKLLLTVIFFQNS